MSFELYKVLHIVGLAILFMGTGAVLLTSADQRPKLGVTLHGIGLLVMVVAGFGMMAKRQMMGPDSWPLWLILKMAVWVLIALLPTFAKKGLVPRGLAWLLGAALAGAAAWLALTKPFVG